MNKLRIFGLATLMVFLISLGAPWIALAPYHDPPPPPPTGVQELSLIHVLFHPGTTKLIAENKGLIFATTTELKKGSEIRIFNATTDGEPGKPFHSPIAIVNEAGRRIAFDIVNPTDQTKVLQAGVTTFTLEHGKPVAIRFKAEAAGKLKVTHADHGHHIELTLEVK